MSAEDYSLAVWKDCEHCGGIGKLDSSHSVGSYVCGVCKGHGKCPTFIPLEKILFVIEAQGNMSIARSPETVTAIQQWLQRQKG